MNNLEQASKISSSTYILTQNSNFFQLAESIRDGMQAHLSTLQSLRGTGTLDAAFSQHLLIVKRWQSALH